LTDHGTSSDKYCYYYLHVTSLPACKLQQSCKLTNSLPYVYRIAPSNKRTTLSERREVSTHAVRAPSDRAPCTISLYRESFIKHVRFPLPPHPRACLRNKDFIWQKTEHFFHFCKYGNDDEHVRGCSWGRLRGVRFHSDYVIRDRTCRKLFADIGGTCRAPRLVITTRSKHSQWRRAHG
jgi:hypothetical protein